jgi:hypothetical protein
MINAKEFLLDAVSQMDARAVLRDSPGGERSMKRAVDMFNAARGTNITTSDGWAFMVCLKMARAYQGKFHKDDYVDMAAFASLLGEEESASVESKGGVT